MPDTYFMWTLEKLQEFWDDHISTLFARKSSVYTKTEIDTKTAALEGAMAVVQSTNTATVAISAGRYVIWKGSLYVALSAIAIGDTLSSSNLTAVSDGGLNALDASRISGEAALSGAITAGDAALSNRIDSVISDIAIIVDGDTCSVAVLDGGYAYVKNNTHGLSEGLYKNTSGGAFPVSGGSATSAIFTAVSGGLGSEVAPLNNDLIAVSNNVLVLSRHTRKTDFSLTDLQAAIADQNLAKYGLKPGDQKTINGRTYVIAGLNTMKGVHVNTCADNHAGLIVIPHTTCKWNASGNTYTGANGRGAGYKNSDLQYYLANDVMQMVNTDLGSGHVYSHKKNFGNAINQTGYNRFGVNSGCTSGSEDVDTYISALTEAQVYGGDHWSSSGYDTSEANTFLPVFQEYKYPEIFTSEHVWLRNVSSATTACHAARNGIADGKLNAGESIYVAGLILYH